jgi:hypothetical protein
MLSPVTSPTLRVPFGLKDGRMVTPAEVASGRACDCVCPGCALPLQARKGEQNIWHFAHDGRGCVAGAETAIHRMAKQILAADRTIRLPAVEVTVSAKDVFGRERTATASLAKPQHLRYTEVALEVASENRRADAIGTSELGIKHWIEVYVRHPVDLVKAQDLEAREYISYEICLQDLPAYLTLEQLRKAVTSSPERIRWISYPGMSAMRRKLTENLERMLSAAARQKKAEELQVARAYAAQVRAAPTDRLGRGRLQREKARNDERVALANQTFRAADVSRKRSFVMEKLRTPPGPTPSLIDVEVRGHDCFGVPRDIWQADVFRKWVYADGRHDVSLETVLIWLAQRYEVDPGSPDSAKVAVWQYFKSLEHAGFVRHKGRQYFEVICDVAPWLGGAVAISGTWFWAPRAQACSLQQLHEANDSIGTQFSTGVLLEIFKRVRTERGSGGQPDDAARTVAQRSAISPDAILSLLAAAQVASRPVPGHAR